MNKITTAISAGLLIAYSASSPAQTYPDSSTSQPSTATRPDNSKSNKLETNRATTAQDQSNNPADIDLTKKIRQSVVADKSLSTYAHNVKIVTMNGNVTLNGVVRTVAEKSAIEMKAAQVAGTGKVTSELKVAPEG